MTNKEFLEKVSRLQKEFKELHEDRSFGLIAIDKSQIHVRQENFHELEREALLEHISKKLTTSKTDWRYEAMTPGGIKIIALESVAEVEDKR